MSELSTVVPAKRTAHGDDTLLGRRNKRHMPSRKQVNSIAWNQIDAALVPTSNVSRSNTPRVGYLAFSPEVVLMITSHVSLYEKK